MRPEEHDRLAKALANRFRSYPVEFEDLLQTARLGLVEAAARFDSSAGTSFATYAVPVVLGLLRRLVEKSRAASGTRGARALLRRAEEHRARLRSARRGEPTLQEIASALGVDAAELAAAIGALSPPVSMADVPEQAQPASGAPDWEERLDLHRALDRLPHRLHQVVHLRFFRGLHQREVARRLGLSQPVVSRREREALALLRRALERGGEGCQKRGELPEGARGSSSNTEP